MIDYQGFSSIVLITTPELEFTQQDINNYSVNFDMEIIGVGPALPDDDLSILYVSHHVIHLTN